MDPLKIPLSDPSVVSDGVSVWEWSGSALDEGAEAAMWFSTHLGKPSRLVRFSEGIAYRIVLSRFSSSICYSYEITDVTISLS